MPRYFLHVPLARESKVNTKLLQNLVMAISLGFAFWHTMPKTRSKLLGKTICKAIGHSKEPNIETHISPEGEYNSTMTCKRCHGGTIHLSARLYMSIEDLLGGEFDLPRIAKFPDVLTPENPKPRPRPRLN